MNIIRSPKPLSVLEIPLEPIHEFVLRQVRRGLEDYEDHICLEDAVTGEHIKLSEVEPAVRKVASGLTRRKFGQGDVLCVCASNLPQFFFPVLAAWMCGGCVTLANSTAMSDQFFQQLTESGAKVLVCDSDALAKALEFVKSADCKLKHIFLMGSGDSPECVTPLSDLLKDDATACPLSIKTDLKEEVVYLGYSSGTTGLPKPVMHTHFSLVATLKQFRTAPNPNLKILITNHFFHISGVFFTLSWLGKGAHLFTLASYSDEAMLKAIQNKKVTVVSTYTHQVTMLSKSALVDRYDLSSVTVLMAGGAVLPANTHRHVSIRLRNLKSIFQMYSLVESFNVCCTSPLTGEDGCVTEVTESFPENDIGCIGFVMPYAAVKIVNHDRPEVALGPYEIGEICVKSPCNMKGYLNKPEETALILDAESWLKTGDLGYHDGEVQIYYVERKIELIKYKAYLVAPSALEAMLLQHPGVEDAAVVGVMDEDCGELPRAYVLRSSSLAGRDLSKDQLLTYVHNNVPEYEQLRGGLLFVNRIPRTVNGKILRRDLKNYLLW